MKQNLMQARCSQKSAISIIAERTLHLLIKGRVASHTMRTELAFSTLAHDTLGIIPLAAGVVTTLRTSAKNSVLKLIDYTTYTRSKWCIMTDRFPYYKCTMFWYPARNPFATCGVSWFHLMVTKNLILFLCNNSYFVFIWKILGFNL